MPVFGQGAPGVRIQLRDQSQIDLVTEPIITGGVVGFSSRGELNKIINITSTADMDVILGPGFNNPQFNQGLYAARAVVQSGGFVEYVRPYGEEIILDDNDPEYDFNQKLKTDTYLVEYNFTTPADPTPENLPDSFATTYMASTRYIQDLLSGLGEREIYTISETIQKNSNVNFFLDADDTIIDDEDTVSLFAIMNSDPTAARRAGDRFDVSDIRITNPVPSSNPTVTVITKNNHGFTVGETIYITGTNGYNGQFAISSIDGAKKFSYVESNPNTSLPESDGAVYINEDTIQSGVDFLEVKTAARGKSSKKLGGFALAGIPLELQPITSIATADSGSDTVVTVTASISSDLSDGDSVNIENSNLAGVPVISGNGVFQVQNVVTGVSFEYVILGVNLGVGAIDDLLYSELGENGKRFTLLLSDGTKLLNEYVVEGQLPLTEPSINEVGPVGLPVVKSNVTNKYFADTFDSTTDITLDGWITVGVGDISNFAVGDLVNMYGTLPPEITAGINIVSEIDNTLGRLKLLNVTSLTATVGTGNIDNVSLEVIDGGKYTVSDTVRFEANAPTGFTTGVDYIVAQISGNSIILNDKLGVPTYPTGASTTYSNLVNMTGTNNSMLSTWNVNGINTVVTRSFFDGSLVTIGSDSIVVDDASKFSVGDQVLFSDTFDENGLSVLPLGIDNTLVYNVSSVNLMTNTVTFIGLEILGTSTGTFQITNLTQTRGGTAYIDPGFLDGRQVNYLGVLGLNIPESVQDEDTFKFFKFIPPMTPSTGDLTDGILAFIGPTLTLIETTSDIMLDSDVGRTFLGLGLANEDYIDIDFDGDDDRVFRLTEDGIQAARFFLLCEYFFAGETYNFAGTILPFVSNDVNLYIENSAKNVANGWTFQINQNSSLIDATQDSAFDLSQSVKDGIITSEFVQIAFNENDPAIINDSVWQYNPIDNRSSSVLAETWNLFLDRDTAKSDMLISAGTSIQNLFVRGFEEIDFNVMDTMLTVCEKRKDMFSIFDGVDAPDIDVALRKMVGIGSQGEISRWGGIFDGRDNFFDSDYTKLNVHGVKTISVAAIITLNRAGNVYWLPPAGYNTGRIPAQYSTTQKFLRSYNYAADPNSDIARLYDANINPTRVNEQGQFIYGQKTMLKKGSALNRMNVIMLVAGLHKRFENYLDFKTFQLNTAALRNNIQSDLQAQLELIKSANPQGITAGQVICDETNNTPDIIDTNQLIVDVVIQPTRAAEFITLRTTVQRTGESLDVTNTIIGG